MQDAAAHTNKDVKHVNTVSSEREYFDGSKILGCCVNGSMCLGCCGDGCSKPVPLLQLAVLVCFWAFLAVTD